MKIKVNAYSGYKADERPMTIFIEGKAYKVKEIKEQFINEGPDKQRHKVFKVKINDGRIHTLFHNLANDEWLLE